MRNLSEQVKKAFCYQKLFWPFTGWTNCSSNLKIFADSWPSASNFKSFSQSLEHFFLIVSQNNFGNKIPFTPKMLICLHCYFNHFVIIFADCKNSNRRNPKFFIENIPLKMSTSIVWLISISQIGKMICQNRKTPFTCFNHYLAIT